MNGWTRRRFLQAVGAGVFAGPTLDALRQRVPDAWAGPPIGPSDGVLVVVTLFGGNDSLNTFVPYGDGLYYSSRPNLAIAPEQVLRVDDRHGFHPQLPYLESLYEQGSVAAVHGLGYPNPNLSHFSSMATWMTGRFGPAQSSGQNTGWIGRWVDAQPADTAAFAACCIGTTVPLHMTGAVHRAVGVSEQGDMFGAARGADDLRMYAGLMSIANASGGRGALHDMFALTMRRQLEVAAEASPSFAAPVGGEGLVAKMTAAARLVNANIGMRVLDVGQEGYDHHELLPSRHPALLAELDAALRAFFTTLAPEHHERVTVMTISEFGRMSTSNSSDGADHGTASTQFVIGRNVRGGEYGAEPSLAKFDRNRRLLASLDFRSLYGSIVDGWLGGGGSTIVNGTFEDLGLFHGPPGSSPSIPGVPVATARVVPRALVAPGGFVPMTPVRVFDTRDGTGGRRSPLGPGEKWEFTFGPEVGVAANATAVAVNVTSVDATRRSFITAWPAGEMRPFTANLNPVPGKAVPNLVVATLGGGGAVSLFNYDGNVHLVGDLVGFFSPTAPGGVAPLVPARLLDTRDGTGGVGGPVGVGQSIDLQVTGRGGVPDGSTAVALNVTVTEPSAPSYVTVWPAGESRPLAASLNMVRGQTVPNMVLARLGQNGRVSLYNYAGSTHIVADVLGAFGDANTGRFVPMTPVRLLDTREGIGAPLAKVGQGPLALPIVGRDGIPAAGVSAVLLNVTAVSPTADTYVTVYPRGAERPLAANLNAVAGQIVPNMVLGRLGDDGAVALFNYAGVVDLVADAMGWFTT
jgi:uncharacterized protein (DUF1501 family)